MLAQFFLHPIRDFLNKFLGKSFSFNLMRLWTTCGLHVLLAISFDGFVKNAIKSRNLFFRFCKK